MKHLFLILLLLIFLIPPVSADTLLVNPVSDTYLYKNLINQTFSIFRENVTATNAYTSFQTMVITGDNLVNNYSALSRWGASYDTSGVGTGTVNGVKFGWKSISKTNNLGSLSINATTFTPSDYTTVNRTANFNKFGNTSLAGWNYADVSTTNYNNASLATSIVNKTGHTALGLRLSPDVNNIESQITWVAGKVSSSFRPHVISYSATGTFLEIDYTPAAAPDTTPPDSITGLTNTTATNCSSINWTWTNPTDADFNHTYVLQNNVWYANLSNTTTHSQWTGLTASTQYNISTHTVDITGNMNTTWVNASYTLPACGVAPVAAFSANNLTICQGTNTQFTDASTNTPDTWYWEFGDGNTSTTQSPLKTYDVFGLMNVYLNASNTYGFDWENKTAYINVTSCAAPIPTPTPTPTPTTPPPTTTVPTPTPAPIGCVFTNISGITVDVNNTDWAITSGGTTWGVMNISNTSISYYRCGNSKPTTCCSVPSYVNTPLSPLLGVLAVMGIAFVIIRKK